ncbi:MAG: patatin-like phospholipase family protein [Candidatus Magnetomorum sp.]|nr:patatin-like phospholipase family protein [Candidatus Magnetomorum sp.]
METSNMTSEHIKKNLDISTALVLSGGGARGAYEAGVIKYILDALPETNQIKPFFNIFSGTSIGALNSCFLASFADQPALSAKGLIDYWHSITIDKIIHFKYKELFSLFNIIVGRPTHHDLLHMLKRPKNSPHPPIGGIFNSTPLFNEMHKAISWERIQECFSNNSLKGISLCATEVCTGNSVIFFQNNTEKKDILGKNYSKEAKYVKINLKHAMASSAIPMIFPAVQINGTCYTDGSLRQNTPVYPALRLGANKMLVISLSQDPEIEFCIARRGCRKNPNPGMLFLLGKILNVLITDALDDELKRIELFNNIIKSGEKIYGDEFLDNINQATRAHRHADYRVIETYLIRPSQNLHQIAVDSLREAPEELNFPGLPGKLLKKLFQSNLFIDSELLSFLMFTPTYINKLIALGYKDASNHEKGLVQFFS